MKASFRLIWLRFNDSSSSFGIKYNCCSYLTEKECGYCECEKRVKRDRKEREKREKNKDRKSERKKERERKRKTILF